MRGDVGVNWNRQPHCGVTEDGVRIRRAGRVLQQRTLGSAVDDLISLCAVGVGHAENLVNRQQIAESAHHRHLEVSVECFEVGVELVVVGSSWG